MTILEANGERERTLAFSNPSLSRIVFIPTLYSCGKKVSGHLRTPISQQNYSIKQHHFFFVGSPPLSITILMRFNLVCHLSYHKYIFCQSISSHSSFAAILCCGIGTRSWSLTFLLRLDIVHSITISSIPLVSRDQPAAVSASGSDECIILFSMRRDVPGMISFHEQWHEMYLGKSQDWTSEWCPMNSTL